MGLMKGLLGETATGIAAQSLAGQQNLAAQRLAGHQGLLAQNELMRSYEAAKQRDLAIDPNTREAYMIPMSQLVTLWRAKHGDKWIRKIEDEFWQDAYERMAAMNMFEKAFGHVRLKDDV